MPIPVLTFARPVILLLLISLVLCFHSGCSGGENGKTTITVFAAASLTDAFREIASKFESENPDVAVKLNFAGSQRLRFQLQSGAAADVFASADERQMQLAQEAGLIGDRVQYFAAASMSVIVSERSEIREMSELGKPGARVVMAHESVPAGAYARQLLDRISTEGTGLGEDYAERVLANVVSEETSVKVVEQKVVLGEADAGIVYLPGWLSAGSSGSVRNLPLPPGADAVRALFPIATLKDADSPQWAVRFVRFVFSGDGRRILHSYGFDAP